MRPPGDRNTTNGMGTGVVVHGSSSNADHHELVSKCLRLLQQRSTFGKQRRQQIHCSQQRATCQPQLGFHILVAVAIHTSFRPSVLRRKSRALLVNVLREQLADVLPIPLQPLPRVSKHTHQLAAPGHLVGIPNRHRRVEVCSHGLCVRNNSGHRSTIV